jgi:tetratricopeptide (TPR) repeat protein
MRSLGIAAALLISITYPILSAEKLPKADRIPEPPTEAQLALIREGVALHDQQNYDGAIAKYKEVLDQNPWEVRALHEIALSYFAAKNYDAALAASRKGAECKSPDLPGFHMMIGNVLDELGKSSEAMDIYREALKRDPKYAMLHFNLGVSLRRAKKNEEAKAELEKSLTLNPAHAGSHLVLATVYQEMGYRVPAIMAFSRFLILEPDSGRVGQPLHSLVALMTQGASEGKNPNEINIVMHMPSKTEKEEGDFAAAELMMSMSSALNLSSILKAVKPQDAAKPQEATPKPPSSDFEKVTGLYSNLCSAMGTVTPKGFAASYYAPYFRALSKAGYTDALTAHAWKAANLKGSADWLPGNGDKIEAFLRWSQSYEWPNK